MDLISIEGYFNVEGTEQPFEKPLFDLTKAKFQFSLQKNKIGIQWTISARIYQQLRFSQGAT